MGSDDTGRGEGQGGGGIGPRSQHILQKPLIFCAARSAVTLAIEPQFRRTLIGAENRWRAVGQFHKSFRANRGS